MMMFRIYSKRYLMILLNKSVKEEKIEEDKA